MLTCEADCLKPGVEEDFQAAGKWSSEPIHLAGVSHSMARVCIFSGIINNILVLVECYKPIWELQICPKPAIISERTPVFVFTVTLVVNCSALPWARDIGTKAAYVSTQRGPR